jgi:hypothetical protein
VYVNGSNNGNISINFTANPTSVNSGQPVTLSWNAANATYCNITGANNAAVPNLTSNQSVYGTATVYPTVSTNYQINCTNSYGQTNSAYAYVTVNGSGAGNMTANIYANITSTTYASQPVTLTWSSTNATYCNISGGSTNLNNQSANGSTTVYPTVSTSYTATCYNSSGQSVTSSPTYVYVGTTGNGNVTATLSANYSTVASGQPVTLTWTSTNANYCSITGNNNTIVSNQSANGSTTVYPSVSTNYIVTCYNNNGQNAANYVYVTINNSNTGTTPTVTVTSNLSNVSSGQQVQLTWYSNNANYCNILSNGNTLTGQQSTSGTYLVVPTQTTTYQVTCYNTSNGQSGSNYVTVTVNGSGNSGTLQLQSNQNRYVTVMVNNSYCGASNSYITWGDGQTQYLNSTCGTQTFSHQYSYSGTMNLNLYVNGSSVATLQVYVQ